MKTDFNHYLNIVKINENGDSNWVAGTLPLVEDWIELKAIDGIEGHDSFQFAFDFNPEKFYTIPLHSIEWFKENQGKTIKFKAIDGLAQTAALVTEAQDKVSYKIRGKSTKVAGPKIPTVTLEVMNPTKAAEELKALGLNVKQNEELGNDIVIEVPNKEAKDKTIAWMAKNGFGESQGYTVSDLRTMYPALMENTQNESNGIKSFEHYLDAVLMEKKAAKK